MARNMITGKETQKMQEFTQEQIDRAEHMGIALPVDVKEQIFEYANLIGEEEKVRTLVKNLTDAINQADEDKVEELLDDAKMDIQDLPDPTIGKLELRDYGYTAEDMVPLRKEAALDYHRSVTGRKIEILNDSSSQISALIASHASIELLNKKIVPGIYYATDIIEGDIVLGDLPKLNIDLNISEYVMQEESFDDEFEEGTI